MDGPERVPLAGLGAADAASLGRRVSAARLVCFPTDTVYGVGGALTPAVADALVAAKGRDPDKPLQVVFCDRSAAGGRRRAGPGPARGLPRAAAGARHARPALSGRVAVPAARPGRGRRP